jgi:hypothetical protein
MLARAQDATAKGGPQQTSAERDGPHDFDFELGSWKIHLKRRLHPLTGSTQWVEFDGTSVTRKVWKGRAELEQFETNGASGHIEGLTLRLYDPESHQWRLYWANSKDGTIGQPMVGEFRNGRGEFYDQESFNGKVIFVRYIWSEITPNSAHFEQSFSDDGGKTWEANWITDQTSVNEDTDEGPGPWGDAGMHAGAEEPSPQHAFDFEFGSWDAHLKRLLHPLTGSNTWATYDGSSVVHTMWNGRANLGEFEVTSATMHLEGLSLRLYNPQTRQWSIYWASSSDGILTPPLIGQFKEGRGQFFDQEMSQGKSIYARFIFSDLSMNSFRLEQAFSEDGGTTWEPNWIVSFTRRKP